MRFISYLIFTMFSMFIPVGMAASQPESPALEQNQVVTEGIKLLMVEQKGCIYCEKWRREIMPAYAKTDEGRAAPLVIVQLDGPWPDGIALARKPFVTPTFVLLKEGAELTRLEGYPGEDFFWPLLNKMLTTALNDPGGA